LAPFAQALVLALVAGSAHADSVERAGDVGAILLPAGAALGSLVARDSRGLGRANLVFTHPRAHVSLGFDASRRRAGPLVTIAW
jgi:hypothetical protein